ncbi:MAG: cell division protein FtsZ [Candidatus Pacebacteria bacterium]|nr:cell division protein FtsZ [Candidatus Paceibacterota bacterium]MBP9818953.1 cell division protein FtsZ [Candidatus Paceibacterota bacterium]
MPQVKPEVETFARIKVVGVGGSGKNATNHMINAKVKSVDFLVVNTDAQDLHNSLSKKKIHIGKNLTKGLGAGMNPEVGKRAAEETKEEIQEALKNSDMVFVAGGLGGGTCTGAGPVVAKIAREMGALTIGVVTKPFSFEGQNRMRLAEQGLEDLSHAVDALVVIPNDKILAATGKDTPATQGFAMCDEVLRQAVEGISDLITMPGTVGNIDFADIRAVLEDAGSALMGIGTASGEKRAEEAAKAAISSPLIDVSIHGAKGVLFSIAAGNDLTMWEIQEAAKIITDSVDPNAKIIFGTVKDEKLKKNEIKITVIAANFPDSHSVRRSFINNEQTKFTPQQSQVNTPAIEEETQASEPRRGIFNSFSAPQADKASQQTQQATQVQVQPAANTAPIAPVQEKKVEATPIQTTNDDDDWGAVPAFLRRSKLK